ncbi:hypothetical protein SDC9_199355 [bioreactor metagenome]|uniref:Uncharacterized protein n=1 Tax=bioreactor metagenome TaxID=1076179 RepID=A0A645IL12_9ZZZZ
MAVQIEQVDLKKSLMVTDDKDNHNGKRRKSKAGPIPEKILQERSTELYL